MGIIFAAIVWIMTLIIIPGMCASCVAARVRRLLRPKVHRRRVLGAIAFTAFIVSYLIFFSGTVIAGTAIGIFGR